MRPRGRQFEFLGADDRMPAVASSDNREKTSRRCSRCTHKLTVRHSACSMEPVPTGLHTTRSPFAIRPDVGRSRTSLPHDRPALVAEKKRPSSVLGSILEVIGLHAEMLEPVSFTRTLCSDPDDDKFLDAAVAADDDYVVSGDAALLSLTERYPDRQAGTVSQVTAPLAFKSIQVTRFIAFIFAAASACDVHHDWT
jgi:predicted nucleic acid-binding protein